MSEALDHEAPLSLPTSENPIVAAAMAYTKEHLDSVTADDVSRAVAVSERTLRRLFQDTLGLSWRTYLLHARMLRAMALLAAPGQSVQDTSSPSASTASVRSPGRSPSSAARRRRPIAGGSASRLCDACTGRKMVHVQADSHPGQHSARPAIVIAALGVVFGDIGTSPIYTLQTVFNPGDPHPVPISRDHIFGIVSLIFWSVMTIVTLTYVTLVMRADNNGEGGIMALITLLRRSSSASGRRPAAMLAALGIFGAALFFGDSMITPAISVLSAVEGLKVVEPGLRYWIVPITAVIIVALFSVQRQGSAIVGRFFGPVMVVWFLAIAACGISGISPTRRSSGRSRPRTRCPSWPGISTSPSSHWPRWSFRSPAPRPSTRTWGISAVGPSPGAGWGWCCRLAP